MSDSNDRKIVDPPEVVEMRETLQEYARAVRKVRESSRGFPRPVIVEKPKTDESQEKKTA